ATSLVSKEWMFMDIEVRPAQASDAAMAVPLIYAAGPAMFEYVFSDGERSSQEFLLYAFQKGNGLFGYSIHHVAVRDGEVLGIYGAYTGLDGKQRSLHVIVEVLRHYGLRAGIRTLFRCLNAERAIPPPVAGRLYICNVAVR